MRRYFITLLKSESALSGLNSWLTAFDSENATETERRLLMIRAEGMHCKLTVIPEDKHYDTILHACEAYGTIVE